jgi:hypothetical protein
MANASGAAAASARNALLRRSVVFMYGDPSVLAGRID